LLRVRKAKIMGKTHRPAGADPLERFQPDCAVDPGRFARGTALRLLAMARHVASTRLVPQANRLGLASHSQAESALDP
jgi:hypothetical protein